MDGSVGYNIIEYTSYVIPVNHRKTYMRPEHTEMRGHVQGFNIGQIAEYARQFGGNIVFVEIPRRRTDKNLINNFPLPSVMELKGELTAL